MREKFSSYTIVAISLLFSMIMIPAYGEVVNVDTDKSQYLKRDQITFLGTVEETDKGLVSIVIRDPNDQFVLLTQATILADNTYSRTIDTKDKFNILGTYNATAFIFNMTAGDKTSFDISLTSLPSGPSIIQEIAEPVPEIVEEEPIIEGQIETNETELVEPNVPEVIEESTIADFVDPERDPQHYVDRYNNEPGYKEWFDNNYPDLTIHEAVGLKIEENTHVTEVIEEISENVNTEILPDAEASLSVVEPVSKDLPTDENTGQMILAIVGLGILFGAVYGVKRQVDNNSQQISQNRTTIREKLLSPLRGSDPLTILKTRLAKGEITLREYNKLKKTLE